MFEPKMKKKTATFLNIKKKITKRKKKNYVTHILFMPKMKKKNCNISDHFQKKKLQTLKIKDFTCMLLWAKSNQEKILTTSRENFANQGDPNSIIAAKFYKLLSSWTN